MDIAKTGSLSSALSPTQTGDMVSTLVLKKAIDIEAQNATQLLQAIPPAPSNPPHLGNGVDVRA